MRHPLSTNPTGTPRRCPTRRIRVRLPLATIEELDHLASAASPHPPAHPPADPRRRPDQRHAFLLAEPDRVRAHAELTRSTIGRARREPAVTIDITAALPPAKALSPRALGEDESDDLWALTRVQRQQAMWNGALTLFQLREWTGRAPTRSRPSGANSPGSSCAPPNGTRSPRPSVAQHRDDHVDNVVAFPNREGHREAA